MLKDACRTILRSSMGVKENESVVIVTDNVLFDIGKLFFDAAQEYCSEPVLIIMRERASHGEEPPENVALAMEDADVLLLPTIKSLSHTQARKNACITGARVASMPHITKDMLMRLSDADVDTMEKDGRRWSKALTEASDVHITTDLGTDLSFSIKGRKGEYDSGLYTKKGAFGNIPAGEAFIAPVEGTANGTLIIDASMASVGKLDEPLRIIVKDGMATGIEGKSEAGKLEEVLRPYGDSARNIAELGIGTNASAIITGATLEDEKTKGTIHIALGDNATFGGTVSSPSHLDGIITRPTLYLDGKKVIDKGNWIL